MRKIWFAWMMLAACLLWASISLASTAAVYEIGTANEYKAFVASVNGGETKACARLTGNIDFNGATLTDISVASSYTGTFDGQNYALQNFTLSASTGSALFQTLGEGGVLKNIRLENVTLRTSASVESTALLCHVNQGRIENCRVTGFSTYSRNVSDYAKRVGVIAYENRNQIIGCTVSCTSLQARNYAGGIACINEAKGLIDGCSTTGEIRAYTTQSAIAECYAGGIAAVNKNSIQNCVNTAKVTAQKSGIAYAGGVAALAIGSADSPARFYRCSNSGVIRTLYANTASIQDRAAGIVAACEGFFEIGKCSNAGTVEAITIAAGIAGTKSAGNDVFINNCWNSGEIKASASVSAYAIGIAGPGGSAKIRNCLNTGSLAAAGKRAPIMIDYASADDEVNCYALESCVAGLSGSDGFPAWNGRIITNSRSQTQIKDDVYRELNNGNSTAVWKQGSVHPELCEEEAVPPTLTGISVTTLPAKTVYKAGESFDPAGMVVTASYSDGSAKEVTGYTVDNGKNLLLTQTGLTISYSEGGKSASTTLRITVKAPVYTVTVEGGWGGGSYEVGESVTIQASVPDGKVFAGWTDPQKVLSDSSMPAAIFIMPAKDVKLTANFADVVPVKLTIQKKPDQKAYYAGEDFDTTGMVLVVEYSDGKSQRIDSGFVLKDGNNLKANQTFVTVSYSRNGVEVTAVQPISVSVRKYTVTVVGGTGGGSYAEGETVSISANQAPKGQYFTGWTGMDGLSSASAGFVMPAHDVNLTANYADIILTSITITAPPAKTEYTEGEFFSPDGMAVTAHYNNGSSEIVGNYAISNTNALTTQDQSITILFTENGITQTAEISISVSVRTFPVSVTNGKGGGNYPEGEMVTVTADEAPKGKYFTGWTGAEELVFTSGSAASASAAFTMPARAVSLEAVYEDIRLTSIVITTPPIQTSYTAGDAFNPSGMKVEARYNDGHSEEIENFDGSSSDEVVLEAKNISLRPHFRNVSLQLHRGEILGLGGLSDCGMHEIGKVLFGIEKPLTGEVTLKDGVQVTDPVMAVKHRMAYVSKDRDKESVILSASIESNIVLPSLNNIKAKGTGYISRKKEKELTCDNISLMRIKCRDGKQLVKELSGGNKQKVVFSKWMGTDSDILILDCPTRGIDVGVKADMYKLMMQLKRQGKAIIMISEELLELIGMSDRMLLFKDGRQTCEFMRSAELGEKDIIDHII